MVFLASQLSKVSGCSGGNDQRSSVTHRYAKLQQSHTDDISRAVCVADRECLGLQGTFQKHYGNIYFRVCVT